MSLMAEAVVEEWLNRQGFFTIRGVKLGVDEMDLLAIRPKKDGTQECRQIEVQASTKPMSYICLLTKADRKATGKAANSPTRTPEQVADGVREWVERKYLKPKKLKLMASLSNSLWSKELVVHNVKFESELDLIKSHDIAILRLTDIVNELRSSKTVIKSASGSDLLELMHLVASNNNEPPKLSEAIAAMSLQS